MRKINKRKILILIVLIISIIIEVRVFTRSRADKLVDISINVKDVNNLINDNVINLQAIDENNAGYAVNLPEFINGNKISKYIIEEKEEAKEASQNEVIEEDNVINENLENTSSTKINKVEKTAGEKLYLTNEELENKQINITVEYDKKEKNDKILYFKQIEQEYNNNKIKIEGYLPNSSTVSVEKIEREEINNLVEQYMNEATSLKIIYDIKIESENTEVKPQEFDEEVKVTINGMEDIDTKNQKYRVIHIDENNQTTEIQNVDTKQNSVQFQANSFSYYAIITEKLSQIATLSLDQPVLTSVGETISSLADVWDGQIATKFEYGNGTEEEPYLITCGQELAYLAQEVNNGNLYEGTFFQLTRDIDLNNNEWAPIGNMNNPFKGVFNGAGRKIVNAKITISGSLPTQQVETYGFFGSIGSGSSETIIKNIRI